MTATTSQTIVDRLAAGPTSLLDREDPNRMVSLFGYASGRVHDRLVVFGALRGDYHPRSFGGALDPQAGLELDGGEVGRIRGSFSRGYRAPTLYERFFNAAEAQGALGPEHSRTAELSIERFLGEHVRVLAVAFEQTVHDLISLTVDDDSTGRFENHGGVHAYGLEAEVEGRWDALRWRATYTRQHTRSDDERPVSNAPRSLATLLLLVPVASGRAEVGVETFYMNRRTTFSGLELPPMFSTNAIVTVHDVVDSLDLSFGITNVFDERTGDPGSEEHRQASLPHDPRTVWLRLGVRLQP